MKKMKLSIELESKGSIDNAVAYLNDPNEKIPYFFYPVNGDEANWKTKEITLPIDKSDTLSYSIYVLAFTGTKFECKIQDVDSKKKIEEPGVTGSEIQNRCHLTGSEKLK